MGSASSPHWCPQPHRQPALRSGCGPAEITALAWHLREIPIVQGTVQMVEQENQL